MIKGCDTLKKVVPGCCKKDFYDPFYKTRGKAVDNYDGSMGSEVLYK